MEITALQTLSPTLLGEMLQEHKQEISNGYTVFNTKDLMASLNVWDKNTGKLFQFHFTDLPEELRKGIHDYTTRLCSEKLLIETALSEVKKPS
jgi:hypothetical protein